MRHHFARLAMLGSAMHHAMAIASLRWTPLTAQMKFAHSIRFTESVAWRSTEPQANAGLLEALTACGRRGRWRAALQLIDQLELSGHVPQAAWLSALQACRRQKRLKEQLVLLERMGSQLTTAACNEVLHSFRLQFDYLAAQQFWDARMMRAGSTSSAEVAEHPTYRVQPDALSYFHMLHLCGENGRWSDALRWLDEMELGGIAADGTHYLATLKALQRDRRWEEGVALGARVPAAALQANYAVSRLLLTMAAEAGDAELAVHMAHALGRHGGSDDYAAVLQACRRQGDVRMALSSWKWMSEQGGDLDECCYAQLVATAIEALGQPPRSPPTKHSPSITPPLDLCEELTAVGMRYAREAVSLFSPPRAAVVANAALGSAISVGRHTEAREALALVHQCQGSLDVGAQLKVLELCMKVGDWTAVELEARVASNRLIGSVRAERGEAVDAMASELARANAIVSKLAAGEAAAKAAAAAVRDWADKCRADLAKAADEEEKGGSVEGERGGVRSRAVDASRNFSRRYSKSIAIPGEDTPIEVLYEDDEILVLTKPTAVSVHPRHRFEAGSMLNRAVHHLGGRVPYVVHRLDAPTSGVLVFAKSVLAARSLAEQFRNRRLSKQYAAVLCGLPEEAKLEVNVPIARHPTIPTLSIVDPLELRASATREGSREALTRFEVIHTSGAFSLCRVWPVTGRMHQIRVHADHIGLPLVGDAQYGSSRQPSPLPQRLMLHALSLEIDHPVSHRRVRFSSALPSDFVNSLLALNFDGDALTSVITTLSPRRVEWIDGPS